VSKAEDAKKSPVTLSIVVVSLTSSQQALNCLQQLRESNVLSSSPGATSEVIVVDLTGDADARTAIEAAFPCVTTVCEPPDTGFAKACNVGIAQARAKHILLIDPFTEIPGRLIPDMILHIDNNERIAAVGPQLIDTKGLAIIPATHFPPSRIDGEGPIVPGAPHSISTAAMRAVDWLPATCLMLNRDALEELGGFEEGFLLQFEEIDWCRRAREAAWHIHHLQSVNVLLLDETDALPNAVGGDGGVAGELPYDGQFSASRRNYVRMHHGAAAALAVDAVKGAQKLVRSAKAAIGLGSEG